MILMLFAQSDAQQVKYEEFAKMLEPIQTKLYGFIRSIVKNDVAADDIFQDTVESALLNIGKLEDMSKFKSWMFQIGKNKAFDELRRKKRRNVTELTDTPPETLDSEVEIFVVKKEQEQKLLEAINALEPENGRIMMLRHFYGMKYSQIADVMGLTEVTLRSRHHRILAQLKKALQEGENE